MVHGENKWQMGNGLAYRMGAWSCILLMAYSLATILIVFLIGGPPQTVEECFKMLHENRIYGLLRLDILTVFIIPLYFVLFYAIYVALRDINQPLVLLSTVFIFIGVTIFLAAPSVFSYARLSDAYWLAKTETERNRLWAAAEAILVTDIWNGTGPRVSGLLVQSGAVVLSVLMLRSSSFSKPAAYIGILTHGLDLVHVILGFFIPSIANGVMAIAGVLYLVWFPLIAIALYRLSKARS